jgi:cell wall-associated NlpC family hydrolase
VAAVAVVVVAVLTAVVATPVGAQPDDLDAKRDEARRIEAQLAENGTRISELDEDYNEATLAVAEAEAGIADAQGSLDAAREDQERLEAEVARRAAAIYMDAGNGLELPAFDAADLQEASSRAEYTSAAQAEDRGLFEDLVVAREELDERVADLEAARDVAAEQRDDIEAQRDELVEATSEQEALLADLEGDIAALVREERERREAEEAAAARAALQQAGTSTPTDAPDTTEPPTVVDDAPEPEPDPDPPDLPDAPPPSSAAGIAVQTAYDQLGDPYVYAAAGPDAFDCSGLTMYAWAAAGVSLPHSSRAQYDSLPHVAMSSLQPGDLVFYGSPIHHVGIYVGGGSYIHAPQTGDVVRIASIYRSDYAGAARPG